MHMHMYIDIMIIGRTPAQMERVHVRINARRFGYPNKQRSNSMATHKLGVEIYRLCSHANMQYECTR